MVRLYHSSPYPLQSGTLEPRTAHREINGVKQPLVFASDNMQESLTYTVPKGVRQMNIVTETGAQVLFLDRETVIGEPDLHGGIYSFDSADFSQVIIDGAPSTQWVSTETFSLKDATYTKITSVNDIMAAGVQILQIGEKADFGTLDFDEVTKLKDSRFLNRIEELVQGGQIRWLNQERGINAQNPFLTHAPAAPANAAQPRPQMP